MRIKFIPLFIIVCILFSCNTSYKETHVSLDSYKIEEGFELEVLAAEPLLLHLLLLILMQKVEFGLRKCPAIWTICKAREKRTLQVVLL